MKEHKIVTYKEIESELGVKASTAKNLAIITRKTYEKKPRESITLGQVLKANKLEK